MKMSVSAAFSEYDKKMREVVKRWLKNLVEEWECDTWSEVRALGKAIVAVGELMGELHLQLLLTEINYANGGEQDVRAEATGESG
jgi:hypothetical protein